MHLVDFTIEMYSQCQTKVVLYMLLCEETLPPFYTLKLCSLQLKQFLQQYNSQFYRNLQVQFKLSFFASKFLTTLQYSLQNTHNWHATPRIITKKNPYLQYCNLGTY